MILFDPTSDPRDIPFDRTFGDPSLPPFVLYADVASPLFKDFHHKLSALARDGQISYRVRYRPPQHWSSRPLSLSGYGVELALKRTDYIVIDDRDAEGKEEGDVKVGAEKEGQEDDSLNDLKPLSSSEVAKLGVNTASYVMDSDDPLETLLKVLQDFPKYSSRIAAHRTSDELVDEVANNRRGLFPPGFNGLWINGGQVDARQTDVFSLVDQLRRERRLIEKFREVGFSANETVNILSHPSIVAALAEDTPPRYDYRDDIEGGNVIIWMNDLEKDSRYGEWTTEVDGVSIKHHFSQSV